MANSYKVIDETKWERAMHCMVFRNSVLSCHGLHIRIFPILIQGRKITQHRCLIGENIMNETDGLSCRCRFRHIILS